MSKALNIAGVTAVILACAAAVTSSAEARGLGGGIRGGNFGGFRAPVSSFRPIGNLPNIGSRIGGIGIGNRIGGLPGGLKPILPPGLRPLPPGLRPPFPPLPKPPGTPPPPHGGGKGGGVTVGVAIGSGLAFAGAADCHYYYKKWQHTGSRHWKYRYYHCLGY